MAMKNYKPEEIVSKLRQVDVLVPQHSNVAEATRRDYNEVRPHSSIGHKAPIELIRASGQACLA